jgi:hypothetical protein
VPDCIKILASESYSLGQSMVRQVMKKYSFYDDKSDEFLIEFNHFLRVIEHFNYICSLEDKNELRYWIFNHNLFAVTPKYFAQDRIFMSIEKILKAIASDMDHFAPG